MAVERYSDLPEEAKAFLASINSENVGDLYSAFRFYGRLPDDAKTFLLNAKPETLKFLKDARKEEIADLERTVRLATAGKAVGKFLVYTFGALFGAFILVAQFGESVTKFFRLFKGGA